MSYFNHNVTFTKKHLNEIIDKLKPGDVLEITVLGKVVAKLEKVDQKGILDIATK